MKSAKDEEGELLELREANKMYNDKMKMFNRRIKIINDYLKTELWMDFEMCSRNGDAIELQGFLDEAGENKIKIIFKRPYMMMCALDFTYDCNIDFISIATGKEASELKKRYNVSEENIIFKLCDTNKISDMYIIAEDIEVQVLETNFERKSNELTEK